MKLLDSIFEFKGNIPSICDIRLGENYHKLYDLVSSVQEKITGDFYIDHLLDEYGVFVDVDVNENDNISKIIVTFFPYTPFGYSDMKNVILFFTKSFGFTSKVEHIEEKLQSGIDVILVIEVQGALKVKELIPESICIFIMPPSMKELRKRLVGRKTETKEKILNRFKTAYQEINEVGRYNYVVTNDEIDVAVSKIQAILMSEKCRVDRIEQVFLGNEEEEIHELLMDNEIFVNEDIKV